MKFLPYLISPAPWLVARAGFGIPFPCVEVVTRSG